MTPTERAQKIVKLFMGYEKASDKSFYDEVLAQIEEAEREAYDRGCFDQLQIGQAYLDKERERVFASAREKAAGIIEEVERGIKRLQEMGIQGDIVPLPARIRAMEADK